MAVPKQKRSKSRQGQRRSHLSLKSPRFSVCPKCGKSVLSHTVCFNCGYYKKMEVFDVMKKLNKKEKKQKEKELKAKEEEEKQSPKKPLSWEGLSKK